MTVTVNSSTNKTPHELPFKEKPIRLIEKLIKFPDRSPNYNSISVQAYEHSIKKAAERKRLFDKHCGHNNCSIADLLVLYRIHKLTNKEKLVPHNFFHIYQGNNYGNSSNQRIHLKTQTNRMLSGNP